MRLSSGCDTVVRRSPYIRPRFHDSLPSDHWERINNSMKRRDLAQCRHASRTAPNIARSMFLSLLYGDALNEICKQIRHALQSETSNVYTHIMAKSWRAQTKENYKKTTWHYKANLASLLTQVPYSCSCSLTCIAPD